MSSMKGLLLTVLLLLLTCSTVPSPAQHMNESDSPCANVVITAASVDCLSKARKATDEKLNSVYNSIRKLLDADDASQLRDVQRLWIRYRDGNCLAERALYDSGTGAEPAYLACIEAMTRERINELEVTYAARLK